MKYTLLPTSELKIRKTSQRAHYTLIVIIVVSFTVSFFVVKSKPGNNYQKTYVAQIWNDNQKNFTTDFSPSFTIYTEGCSIPFMEPFDESVKKFNYRNNDIECPYVNHSILDSNKTHIWIIEKNKKYFNITRNSYFSCCYKQFYRPDSVDNVWSSQFDDRIKFEDKCTNFTRVIKAQHEFVKVACYLEKNEVYKQLYLFAIKKKMKEYGSKEISANKPSYNVLILGIDNVSRMNLHRTMPATISFLKNHGAVELKGYTKVGLNSYPNIIPMLTGYECYDEFPKICYPHGHATFDNCPFIWDWFKQAGYYNALGEDSARFGTFNYLADGFIRTPTDYYLHPFTYQAEQDVATKGTLCLQEKYFFQVVLDYLEDITDVLKTKRLFAFFWEVNMSHNYLNYPMFMDDSYVKFFKKLEISKYLEESVILLVSDHGIRWGNIRGTTQGRLEEMMPFVFILTPQSFQKKYGNAFNNLHENSKRLTTPYDIHETLADLVNLENIKDQAITNRSQEEYTKKRGISLFLPMPLNRTCKAAGIDNKWCACNKRNLVSLSSNVTKEAGLYLMKNINGMLKNYSQCSKLSLSKVLNITELVAGLPASGETRWSDYVVVIKSFPGDNVFEALLRRRSKRWQVIGTVYRLNPLQYQYCLLHPLLRLYCHCRT